ncbi:MAG: transposase [Lachnospiraceae bacterium]|nr:transposase [Lachnospiraceae bacterium]
MSNCKKPAFRMLFLIATPKLVHKGIDLFKKDNIPVQYIFHGQGTASSEIMDTLGLSGEEKNILITMLPKTFADSLLIKLQKQLHLGMPNSGVAFTLILSGCNGRIIGLIENLHPEEKQKFLGRYDSEMIENEYDLIVAIVNQGFSEEVMEAARPMGASGGTVFHSRRIGNEDAMQFWGIRIQQEREVVLILAQKEKKLPIMQAICQQCGMQSEAHGIVLSLPVDGIIGLND